MPELLWEGKYDARAAGRPPRVSLPFQTVETVNESVQERQRSLDFFAGERPADWRNRLIWGDKKYVLPSLLDEFAGQVDLIYIDPPFATGADFSFSAAVPESDETIDKQPSVIEQKAYRDTWGKGLDSYVHWLADTANYLGALLSPTGISMSIWIGGPSTTQRSSLTRSSESMPSRTRSFGDGQIRITTPAAMDASTTRCSTTDEQAASSIRSLGSTARSI